MRGVPGAVSEKRCTTMQSRVDVRELSEGELTQVSGGFDTAAIEKAFGNDITPVRVHTGSAAAEAVSVLGAYMYTMVSYLMF